MQAREQAEEKQQLRSHGAPGSGPRPLPGAAFTERGPVPLPLRRLGCHRLQSSGFGGPGGTGVSSERGAPDGPGSAGRTLDVSAPGSSRRAGGREAAGGGAPSSCSRRPAGYPLPGLPPGSELGPLGSEAGREVAAALAVPSSRGGEEFPQLTRLATPGEGSEV